MNAIERVQRFVHEFFLVCPRCSDMHRRAQAAESAAAKVIRQNDHERLWKTVADLKRQADYNRQRVRWWRTLYREAADKIRDSGLVESKTFAGSATIEGRLNVLVDRLVEAARCSSLHKSDPPVKP